MRRIITVLLVAFLLTGCSWLMKTSRGWAQEKATQAQQIEKFNTNMLDLKSRYGAEVMLSAKLQLQVLALRKQVKQLREALTATVTVEPIVENPEIE